MTARVWVIILSVIESIQLLVLTGELVNIFPSIKRMDSEVARYVMFCVLVVGMGYGLNKILAEKIKDDKAMRRLRNFSVIEMVITGLLISAMYKMVIYDYRAELARSAYQWLLVVSVLNKVLWFKIEELGRAVGVLMTRLENRAAIIKIVDVLFVGLIILIIYVPDPQAVVARMFIGEQFHHWDSSVLAAGWAYVKGSVLGVDVISRYGLGMPIIVAQLTRLFGGFNFENVFLVLMWMTIVYYLLWFALLRAWFHSAAVAMAAILIGIKVQMFRSDAMPFVFTYPSATILRYCFDIFVLVLIFVHLRKPLKPLLIAASILCGVALFHVTPEGMYLTAAFYFYLAVSLLIPSLRSRLVSRWTDLLFLLLCVALVPVAMLAVMYVFQKNHLWSDVFWKNTYEFVGYHTSGFGLTPIFQSLKDRNFLASLMGFVLPLVYFFTVTVTVSLCFFKKIHSRHIFAAVVGIYGLGLYHYYVGMSNNVSYYGAGLPFIFLVGFWIDGLLRQTRQSLRTKISLGLLCAAIFALVTTHLFVAYPNRFNLSRNPMVDPLVNQIPVGRQSYFHHLFWEYPDTFKMPLNSLGKTDEGLRRESDFLSDAELKAYYRREFDFSIDADLIAGLTGPDDKVALISSFEIKILMQANRKPFFYYFPIVNSRPMDMRIFVVPNFFTLSSTARTIDQLRNEKPEYIFMETIFLNRNVPGAYFYDSKGFMELLDYVFGQYEPSRRGKYLTAMKRKS